MHHIDQVLREDDLDGDGKISYNEFLASEEKHA
jgi:Ca2+-binding EF-hand superfamily protein